LPWAQLSPSKAVPSDDPDFDLIPTDIDIPTFAAVLNGALTLYDETVGFWLSHAGYPSMVWAEAKRGDLPS